MARLGASGPPHYSTLPGTAPAVLGGEPVGDLFIEKISLHGLKKKRTPMPLSMCVWKGSPFPTHIPYLFACLYEIISCVCVFFSACLSVRVSRLECFVIWSIFITKC